MSAGGIVFFVVLSGLAIGAMGMACLCALDYWVDREKQKEDGHA